MNQQNLKAPSERTRVGRKPQRVGYDPKMIYSVIDEALICHVGFIDQGSPVVIPTIHARIGDELLIHGSTASRMIKVLEAGAPACITVTLMDGLVLARSSFAQSMNYRSVVIFGESRIITSREKKLAALRAISDHLVPGRWEDAREPSENELNITQILAFPLSEASVKTRQGPPIDHESDYARTTWAGIIPARTTWMPPVPDSRNLEGVNLPKYLERFLK